MSRVKIRLADGDDVSKIINFIDCYWKKGHIFVRDSKLFEWQYKNPDGRWNIVLAESNADDGSSTLLGVLGFIPFGRYDPSLGDDCIFLAVWKVREDVCPPGVGLQMLKYINKNFSPCFLGAIGISDMVKPIYRALGYHTGKLDHLALFNPSFSGDYRVAKVPGDIGRCEISMGAGVDFVEVDFNSEMFVKDAERMLQEGSPTKSLRYLKERYLDHPWYSYNMKCVVHEGALISIVVWRVIDINNRSVIRVVDIVGDRNWLKLSGSSFLSEVEKLNAEYVDIMASGVSVCDLKDAGFYSSESNDGLVIPNYFSPFVQSNIDVFFAYKNFSDDDNCQAFFRADSDQDRPN